MATATKSKKAKTKATRKKGDEQNSTPKITNCPFVSDDRRPHTTESSGILATRVAVANEAVETWTAEIRKAFADGTKKADLPDFPVSKHVNPNTGRMSMVAHGKLIDEYNDAIDNDTALPALMGRYNPITVDLIHTMNCEWLRRGSKKNHPKPPKNWDEKLYGSWYHDEEMEDGSTEQFPSGWFFDKKLPRRCHAERAEMLITDPGDNILSFGNLRIVVGSGTHDGSAVFLVNQTSHGNYRAGDVTRKRMSFASVKELRDIVFRIEDRANNGGGFTVKGNWSDVREMVYMPGQVLTAGFLYDAKGKVIDAKAIRKLDGDTKGLRFKALEAPIVGKVIPWADLWKEIQVADRKAIKAMRERDPRGNGDAGSTQTKAITNICVNGKRVDPSEAFPFGLRGSQCNMPAFIVATGEGKIEEGYFGMGVILGERANTAYNVGVHAARGEEEEEEEEAEETPAPKAKAKAVAKPKAKAVAKPKAKAAAKPSDAAPLEQANTKDEAETATADTEPVTA